MSELRNSLDGLALFLGESRFPEAVRPVADRVAGRLERDVLPRLGGIQKALVVGIVGPNNSGKSSLFNGIIGASEFVSPVSPTGGFTGVLVGAAHPGLTDEDLATLARRYQLRPQRASRVEADQVRAADDPFELLLVRREEIPERLLLIDAPDFDSIYAGNREAGKTLLRTADLLLVVVTPHTYQNRVLVEFLQSAVSDGRPFCLIYNQAPSENVARAHCEKLAADAGHEPIASLWAAHDIALQASDERTCKALTPVALPAITAGTSEHRTQSVTAVAPGTTVREWLRGLQAGKELLSRARAASWAAFRQELEELCDCWETTVLPARRTLERAEARARPHADAVASALFPMQPFREALQALLDERSLFHRGLRYIPMQAGSAVRRAYASVSSLWSADSGDLASGTEFRQAELDRLRGSRQRRGGGTLGALWEAIHRELQAERDVIGERALEQDFSPGESARLADRLSELHAATPIPFDDFRDACAESIAAELGDRTDELGLQWAYTALKVIPPAAAVTVAALTGVAGDLGAGVAYFVAEPLLDRAVGRKLLQRVHENWRSQRSDALTSLLLEAMAPSSTAELRGLLQGADTGLSTLRNYLGEFPNDLPEEIPEEIPDERPENPANDE